MPRLSTPRCGAHSTLAALPAQAGSAPGFKAERWSDQPAWPGFRHPEGVALPAFRPLSRVRGVSAPHRFPGRPHQPLFRSSDRPRRTDWCSLGGTNGSPGEVQGQRPCKGSSPDTSGRVGIPEQASPHRTAALLHPGRGRPAGARAVIPEKRHPAGRWVSLDCRGELSYSTLRGPCTGHPALLSDGPGGKACPGFLS
jgi:hypothetical protein